MLSSVAFLSAEPVLKIITSNDYCEFLKAIARTDRYGLYHPKMGLDSETGSIIRTGTPGYYNYHVIEGRGEFPINYVTRVNLMRLCNWYQNGMPHGDQGPVTTEDGAYAISESGEIITYLNANYFLHEGVDFSENSDLTSNMMPRSELQTTSGIKMFSFSKNIFMEGEKSQLVDDDTAEENKFVDAAILIDVAEAVLDHRGIIPLEKQRDMPQANQDDSRSNFPPSKEGRQATKEYDVSKKVVPQDEVLSANDKEILMAQRELQHAKQERDNSIISLARIGVLALNAPNHRSLDLIDHSELEQKAQEAHQKFMIAAKSLWKLQQQNQSVFREPTRQELLDFTGLKENKVTDEEVLVAYKKASKLYDQKNASLTEEEKQSHVDYIKNIYFCLPSRGRNYQAEVKEAGNNLDAKGSGQDERKDLLGIYGIPSKRSSEAKKSPVNFDLTRPAINSYTSENSPQIKSIRFIEGSQEFSSKQGNVSSRRGDEKESWSDAKESYEEEKSIDFYNLAVDSAKHYNWRTDGWTLADQNLMHQHVEWFQNITAAAILEKIKSPLEQSIRLKQKALAAALATAEREEVARKKSFVSKIKSIRKIINFSIPPSEQLSNELLQLQQELRRNALKFRENAEVRIRTTKEEALKAQNDLSTKYIAWRNEGKPREGIESLQEQIKTVRSAFDEVSAATIVALLHAESNAMVDEALRGIILYPTLLDIPIIRITSYYANDSQVRCSSILSDGITRAEQKVEKIAAGVRKYNLPPVILPSDQDDSISSSDFWNDELKYHKAEYENFEKWRGYQDVSIRSYSEALERASKKDSKK